MINLFVFILKISFPKKEFELISSFESLKKINTYFLNFENTKELNQVIIESIIEKNMKKNFNDMKVIIQELQGKILL